ncbi:MAG: NADH:ubiquinone reductase (Na(+)-transporting) subunit B [Candidatus Hydrogenedens sp.]|nr:NADH:ubiquinone reductase (Na(+)-transporting) subunit B [Candidatus Hydrogenedens sp.]
MKALRDFLDSVHHHFQKGGKYEKFYPFYEANDTILFTPDTVTTTGSHVRDGLDLKRMMITVVLALLPCMFMAMYNTGYQANVALADGMSPENWRGWVINLLGIGFSPTNIFACIIHGALYYIPVLAVTFIVGGHIEVLFSIVRKHEINEGFLVTGMLFPLILPPTIPLWEVAVGIAFGVIVGKEIFGGTGMNILNPALTARAFLFFAYPAQMSGDKVWTAVTEKIAVDGWSGATALGRIAAADASNPDAWRESLGAMHLSWLDAFVGNMAGSMGETSALACLIGAGVLILTGIGSWRTMAGCVAGVFAISTLLNAMGSETNAMMNVPFYWHLVLGSAAFALVFMATDPVSGPYTERGRLVYGFLIGVFAIVIRVINPAYPEGWMLAILFMNVFSPLIDYVSISANVKRRLARSAA